jgi:hypothetical protein
MTTKTITATCRTLDAATRRIAGRASSEQEDHMGDCVVARGIDTAGFLKNPVLLANHDPGFVLGKVTRLWVAPTPEGDALLFEAAVLPEGISQRVDERWGAIQMGAGIGISIGFIAEQSEPRQASGGRVGWRYTKTRLLEISSVALPACPTCLVEQRSACACGGQETVVELDDEDVGLDAATVVQAVRTLVPGLARAAVARQRGRVDDDDMIDLAGIADHFDPLRHPADRAMLVDAMRTAIPALLRAEMNRLRGRVD